MPTYEELGYARSAAIGREDSRAVFGQVMGLVAVTLGFTALGAYLGRNLTGSTGILLFFAALAVLWVGLGPAVARGREQLAIGCLFAVGLLLGIGVGPVLAAYAKAEPGVLWQAAGATAAFTAGLGAFGYATSRDLAAWARPLLFALVGLLLLGVVLIFVNIPHANVIYAVLGLIVFGGLTMFDFNRLRRAHIQAAPLIAASIFLDIFNVFLFMLRLLGGGRN
jgi:modulator of FtsH protease